jgi:tetratricopeptide (TPR) repeat protein
MKLLWWHYVLALVAGGLLAFLKNKFKEIWNKKMRPQMKEIKSPYYPLTKSNAGTIIFLKYYYIVSINGLRVDTYSLGNAGSGSILLPPGNHVINFNYYGNFYVDADTTQLMASNLTVQGKIEAGNMYVIKTEVINKKLRPVIMTSYFIKINNKKVLCEYFDDGNQGHEIYHKYKKVIKNMDSLLLQNTNDAKAYYIRSLFNYNLGNYKEAIFDSTEAIKSEPENDEYKRLFEEVKKEKSKNTKNELIDLGFKIMEMLKG